LLGRMLAIIAGLVQNAYVYLLWRIKS